MKKINIFLASSIVEFSSERMAVENFIRNVSDKFEERYNVKIQPLLCENFDDAYTKVRKQEEYNETIRGSDFCFFIFFTKVGKYTREEFDVAREQFEKTGSPRIHTYFKVIEEGTGEASLYAFMKELDEVFGHYYGTFSHIDTVKLRILLNLKLTEMDFLEIKADGGRCVIDGIDTLPLYNVAEFANHKELQKLTKELEKAEAEYYELKPLYETENPDPDFYKRYSAVASRRQSLMDEIDELQKLIFQVSLRMAEDDAHGTITERQKRAYRLFEQGDYEGCMSVLDSNDIDSDFPRDTKRLEEQKLTVCRKYIREHKIAIDILGSMTAYKNRFAEIEERYQKILPYILEFKTETETAWDYISYLINQGKDHLALPIAEKLAALPQDDAERAQGLNLLGILYSNTNNAQKAETCYLEAIAIKNTLAAKGPDLARSYNNAGLFYNEQGYSDKAEEYYLKAIAIWEALTVKNPDRYDYDLAATYNNAGLFYKDQGRLHKAEEYYLKAIAIWEALAPKSLIRYGAELIGSYNNIGNLYDSRSSSDKAEAYYLKAIAISETLALENPVRYNGNLAACYNNAGAFYSNQGDPNKAEAYYLKAIALRETLALENPDKYNAGLAISYNNAGLFYSSRELTDKAEAYYLKAIAIREALALENPDRYNASLAESYNNAGFLYIDQGNSDKAEEYYLKAIAIREALASKNPERYTPALAMSYLNYGFFKMDFLMLEKALSIAKARPDHPICKRILARLG